MNPIDPEALESTISIPERWKLKSPRTVGVAIRKSPGFISKP
jgi:hypothetical protein